MSLFAIGDLHLSFSSQKPMDIFSGWKGYIDRLTENWESLVRDTDTVVIPGDISWAMDLPGFQADADFLNRLPGKKIMVKGNHDYWWTTLSKMNAFLRENGFDTLSILHNNSYVVGDVCICGTRGWFFDESAGSDRKVMLREVGRLETSLKSAAATGLEPVVFLHFPPIYGSYECREILDVMSSYGVRRCFYGHLHGKAARKAFEGLYGDTIFRLVSCDTLGFSPVIIEK